MLDCPDTDDDLSFYCSFTHKMVLSSRGYNDYSLIRLVLAIADQSLLGAHTFCLYIHVVAKIRMTVTKLIFLFPRADQRVAYSVQLNIYSLAQSFRQSTKDGFSINNTIQ